MPKRQSLQKIDSSEIMGEDSFIKIIPPTVKQQSDYRNQVKPLEAKLKQLQENDQTNSDEFAELQATFERLGADLLATHVVDWNWVADEAGKIPLASPHGNPDVFLELNQHEQQWIIAQFNPSQEKKDT